MKRVDMNYYKFKMSAENLKTYAMEPFTKESLEKLGFTEEEILKFYKLGEDYYKRANEQLNSIFKNEPYVYTDESPAPMHLESSRKVVSFSGIVRYIGYRGSDLEIGHNCSCDACKE